MPKAKPEKRLLAKRNRRSYSEDFKQDAVQLLLDGHSAPAVAERLGLPGPGILYRWKRDSLGRGGPVARSLDQRVAQLQDELRRVERERDILKKALSILSRNP